MAGRKLELVLDSSMAAENMMLMLAIEIHTPVECILVKM
jgi:hypothetical protein